MVLGVVNDKSRKELRQRVLRRADRGRGSGRAGHGDTVPASPSVVDIAMDECDAGKTGNGTMEGGS